MVRAELMTIGRTVGLENWGQIKQFYHAVKNRAAKAAMHLEVPQKEIDKLAVSRGADIDAALLQIRKMYPEADKNVFDIVWKTLGKKSGVLSLNTAAKAANGENLGNCGIKVAANSAGFRVAGKGSSCIGNASTDFEFNHLNDTKVPFIEFARAFVEKLNCSVEDGIAHLRLPKIKIDGNSVRANSSIDKSVADEITRISSHGRYQDFGKLLEEAKALLS